MGDEIYVALLRGINVGGNNKLPMRSLVAIFEAAGCREVRTYIQSGNIVFRTGNVGDLAIAVAAKIAVEFGIRVPVILRSAAEMAAAVAANPFVAVDLSEEMLHVYFLAHWPSAEAVAELDMDRSPGDTFVVVGREIYLHLPDGVARTKLTNAYFDKALGTVSTLRNWRTLRVLAAMAGV